MSKTISLSSTKTGKYAAGKIPGFITPSGTVQDGGFYADVPDGPILETVAKSQNMKVEFAGSSVFIFIGKQKDGKALFVAYKGNGSGRLMVGIATNANDPGPMNNNVIHLDEDINAKLGGGVFEFGKIGYEYYLNHSGKEIFRKQQFEVWGAGSAAVYGSEGQNGVGYFKATFSTTVNSDIAKKVIRADRLFTPGSQLASGKKDTDVITFKTLADAKKWKVGDLGFIPCGYETETIGVRNGLAHGFIGPDGTSCGEGYVTQEDLEAANPEQKYSWVIADGKTRQRYVDVGDGKWIEWQPGLTGKYAWFSKDWEQEGGYNSDHYIQYVYAKPKRFYVLAKKGNSIVIDSNLRVGVKDAPVWHDGEEIYNNTFAFADATNVEGVTLQWPKGGEYFFGDDLHIEGKKRLTQVFNNTTFVTPSGAYMPMLWVQQTCASYKQYGAFTQVGNVNDKRAYAGRWWARFLGGNRNVQVNSINCIADLGGGMMVSSPDHDIKDVTIIDSRTAGIILGNGAVNGQRTLTYKRTSPLYRYNGWTDNTTDGVVNCVSDGSSIEAPTLVMGFEAYGGTDSKWINFTGVNTTCSSNTSENIRFDTFNLRFTKNCRTFQDVSEPIFNLNENSGRLDLKDGGGVYNGIITFEDYVDEEGNYKRGIVVQAGYNNAIIDKILFKYAKPYMGGATVGCVGVSADALNTMVSRVTCLGSAGDPTSHPNCSNIIVTDGVLDGNITDCFFLKTGTIKNNKSKFAWLGPNVIDGGGNEIETVMIWPY